MRRRTWAISRCGRTAPLGDGPGWNRPRGDELGEPGRSTTRVVRPGWNPRGDDGVAWPGRSPSPPARHWAVPALTPGRPLVGDTKGGSGRSRPPRPEVSRLRSLSACTAHVP